MDRYIFQFDLCGGTQHFNPPLESVLALSSEEVYVVLELELKHKILLDFIFWSGSEYAIAEKWQTGQWKVILKGLVEEQTRVGEHHPELLPTVGVLEFP